MTVRRASWKDLSGLTALAVRTYRDAFGETVSDQDLAHILEDALSTERVLSYIRDDVVLVNQRDAQLLGFVQLGPTESMVGSIAGPAWELRRLYVLSGHQGRGIGTALMTAGLAHPQIRGADKITLDVWEHNHRARRFYERFGFEVTGRRSFEVASGAETDFDLIMVRRQRPTPRVK